MRQMRPRSGVVILAAGSSSRLGRPKQLVEFRGKTLLRHAAETALSLQCGPVVVVLGAGSPDVSGTLQGLDLLIVENPGWREGMASSIREGLTGLINCFPETDGALITLCDLPLITAGAFRQLIQSPSLIAAAAYKDTLGVPAWFDRTLFPELLALRGAQGAKAILNRYKAWVSAVAIPEAGVDIDTLSDIAALQIALAPSGLL